MDSTLSTILKILAVCGPIGGAIAWLLTALLNNRKEVLTLQLELKQLQDDMKELENEVDRNRRDYEHWKDNNNHRP